MKILKEFSIIMFMIFIADLIKYFIKLPLPNTIIGMILLFILLEKNIIKEKSIVYFSEFILINLAFFFIPAGVSLIKSFDILNGNWIKIIILAVSSTIITMIITGHTVQFLIRRKEKKEENERNIK